MNNLSNLSNFGASSSFPHNNNGILSDIQRPITPLADFPIITRDFAANANNGLAVQDINAMEIRLELQRLNELPSEFADSFRFTRSLLVDEIFRLENNIETNMLRLDNEKPIRMVRKILVPESGNPRYNYAGRLFGINAENLKRLRNKYKCQMDLLGRNSLRNPTYEYELLNSGDPSYAHLVQPLHLVIKTAAPVLVAYRRVTGLMEEIQETFNQLTREYYHDMQTQLSSKSSIDRSRGHLSSRPETVDRRLSWYEHDQRTRLIEDSRNHSSRSDIEVLYVGPPSNNQPNSNRQRRASNHQPLPTARQRFEESADNSVIIIGNQRSNRYAPY
ncbi:Gap associated protein-related [Aphelenchoides besseyi]|nr:Gap associated protein-related [Aphelenchoides besseyi]KAI6194993.1 Gap associated protein-related [Aphelenchoides besseyi]